VTPLGSETELPIGCRIVAATHRDLLSDVAAGKFREDLYYRLDNIAITLPPLRERPREVRALAEYFVERSVEENPALPGRRFSAKALSLLEAHAWPGNVRELIATVYRSRWLAGGERIGDEVVRMSLRTRVAHGDVLSRPLVKGQFQIEALLDEVRRHYFQRAMTASGGHVDEAGALLGLQPRTARNWRARYAE